VTLPILSSTPINPTVFSVPVLYAPTVTDNELSDTEKAVMMHLSMRLTDSQYQTQLRDSQLYYQGLNIVPSLGISVPPELETLRGILGWSAIGIDARSERLAVEGFRMPGQTTVDTDLQEIWQTNNLDAESALVHESAMVYGRAYVVVGKADDAAPLITAESPTNMLGSWNVRDRRISAAYQTYFDVDPASETYLTQLATLYTKDATIQLAHNLNDGKWIVQDRDDHNMGIVPVIQFACRARISDRLGASEITAAWRNCQDRACRTIVRQEITGEFFANPKVWLLGASEQAFQDSDGNLKTAWETFIGRISALEADDNGVLPDVKFQQGSSPDGFISSLTQERQLMASHMGVSPDYLGITSDGNPASADAITKGDYRLKKRADRIAVSFGNDWEEVMRVALQIDGSALPDGAARMETDWDYTGIPTPNADTVTITTQVQAGMVPPDSDDAMAAVGWTPVQRERIAADRKRAQGNAVLAQALQGLPGLLKPQQPMDGQQPGALAAAQMNRDTNSNIAG
jgi:hypothetical protein